METDEPVLIDYQRGPVEVWGRRMKMEYVGMASVFAVIVVLVYGGQPWPRSLIAMMGSFFLFLGLKKKSRDHLMCSFLLFMAALLARPAVLIADWALPLLLFGATVFSLERYIEKRPSQVYVLPMVLAVWGWVDGFWLLGLLFAATYLFHPRADRPGWRRRLALTVVVAAAAGGITTVARLVGPNAPIDYWPSAQVVLGSTHLTATAALVLVALIAVAAYWRRLIVPHRINPLFFAALAPWDVRLAAIFGMVAAVLLAATIFRHSIDSDRARPFFKHAEWHFFWWVLALAVWALAKT
ncbi:MAG: hypothetical protein ACC742_04350 [Thermoanaerobaculales bacterium]